MSVFVCVCICVFVYVCVCPRDTCTCAFIHHTGADVAVYDVLLPLYFPRSDDEARGGSARLPQDIGDPLTGAPHFPDRDVRVTALPGGGGSARTDAAKEVVGEDGTGLNLNRSFFKSDFDAPFTAMRSDLPASSRADDPTVAAALVEGKCVAVCENHGPGAVFFWILNLGMIGIVSFPAQIFMRVVGT